MQQTRLLIVEDDPSLLPALERALQGRGYAVRGVATAEEGIRLARSEQPQVLLLDLGLPDMHGLRVLEVLAAEAPETRICIMSAFSALETKLAAFSAGSDDYVVKPFDIAELEARIQALLKRGKRQSQRTLVLADTCIFRGVPLVQRGNREIALSPLEHRLLLYLAERAGTVVSRSELLDEVWQGADRYPNTVDVHVEYLRKKLDQPFARKTIRTAYRQGYYYEP